MSAILIPNVTVKQGGVRKELLVLLSGSRPAFAKFSLAQMFAHQMVKQL